MSIKPQFKPWTASTEIVGVTLTLRSTLDNLLPANYGVGLHAWFLHQVRDSDPILSAYLHDGESEKPFTLSPLVGKLLSRGDRLLLPKQTLYRWTITALYKPLCKWLAKWLKNVPEAIDLRDATLPIEAIEISLPAMTYKKMFKVERQLARNFTLSFTSPTGFRSKGHHLPLPIPRNVFHSYLRRWSDFAKQSIDKEEFLNWVEEKVYINSHNIATIKTAAGKRGMVTGFTGVVEFGIDGAARNDLTQMQLLQALVRYAPYCGTGHKTTFGLGQTSLGEAEGYDLALPAIAEIKLADRIAALTDIFLAQRKRPNNDRSRQITATWATVLARREFGESLQDIAVDLELNYQTAKTYVKLARRALREHEGN
ncbi:CRISPR-associated protein, Cas6 family [Thalassoporum mexicanum PCC 7367]|uniref:CRISPR-associated endoribonuclease Cas6 n=1 Tax=Thalassoporum mexicanum TaxID=3457544 RepID=UPI00029FCB71|nr:CRISPR-associated endoribonuclease Cas6 [Pseudanabaena sp. PCC 7367]AFY68740.1 CRISPR-associated protein, Cas6 family [Pseudanabaena sp. PCC 7367]